MKKPRFLLLPIRRTGDPRVSVLAAFVQLTLIAIVVPALIVPVAWDLLRDDAGRQIVPERISFMVALPTDGTAEREPARAGGDGRPPSDAAPTEAPPLPALGDVPTGVPVAPGEAPPSEGVGPLIGGGGPLRGIQPTFTDQRLWVSPSDIVIAPIVPLTRADTLRLMLRRRAIAFVDSLARLPVDPAGRQGDWTFERGGKKYGVDGQFIRLGDFTIPTNLLALLPMNVQGNPMALERARNLDAMRLQIVEQAARSIRDEEFRNAVNALRERKERERREAEAARRPPQP